MSNSSCVLYVGAIPYNWDVEVIKAVVCGSGPIVDVRCMMDNASKNKGFCFVEYLSPLDALNALTTLSKLKIEGRKKLRIELSKEGLRNSVHLSKPVLRLNRLLLPANVVLPAEMKESVVGLGLDQPDDAADGTVISTKDQDMELDEDVRSLKQSVLNNTDIRTMVSQMLANGMDLHQIASLITQFNAKNDAASNSNSNSNSNSSSIPNSNPSNTTNPSHASSNNPSSATNNPLTNPAAAPGSMAINGMGSMGGINGMHSLNMGINGMHPLNMGMSNMNAMGGIGGSSLPGLNYMNGSGLGSSNSFGAKPVGMAQGLGGASRLLNSSSYLPQPTASMQTALQGQQQQQQQQQQRSASTNSSSPASPPIPDPVSKTLSTIPPGVLVELLAKLKLVLSTPQPSANTYADAAAILNENPKLAVAAAQALLLMGVVDLDVISQANSIPNGVSSAASSATAPAANPSTHNAPAPPPPAAPLPPSSSANAPAPALPGVGPNIPHEWLTLPQHTVAKLLQLNAHEASLIFQVLQLSPDQIAILPLNERNMANQIRSQYL